MKCVNPSACMTTVVFLLLMNGVGIMADKAQYDTGILSDDSSHAYQCGKQGGGRACQNGLCCSNLGWCGTTSLYCGDGCQSNCHLDNQKNSGGNESTSISANGSVSLLSESTDSSETSVSNGSDGTPTKKTKEPTDGNDQHKHSHSDKHKKSCVSGSSTSIATNGSISISLESNTSNTSHSSGSNGTVTTAPTPTTAPPPTKTGISSILSSAIFDQFLPNRTNPNSPAKGFYTYDAFIKAASDKMFQGFGTTKDVDTQKREIAAFFANVAHETGGGAYVEEINKSPYCNSTCPAGKQYFGRGPLQLSWDYGYAAAGKALGTDLLSNPDKLSSDNVLAFRSSLWFWMSSQSPSCHDVMAKNTGFGGTIKIINGGLECGDKKSSAGATEQQDRINLYEKYCKLLGVSPGNGLSC